MPILLDLPVELHLMINSEIPLNDIEEFSLCCKVIHQCSEKRLMEQYARRRHYSTVAVAHIDNRTWDEDQQIRGVHPLSVLRDLIADPRARLYVKTLILGSIEGTHPLNLGDPCKAELDVVEFQDLTAQLKHEARLLREVLDV